MTKSKRRIARVGRAGAEAIELPCRNVTLPTPSGARGLTQGGGEAAGPRLVGVRRHVAGTCRAEAEAEVAVVVQAPDRRRQCGLVPGRDDEPVALVADEPAPGG